MRKLLALLLPLWATFAFGQNTSAFSAVDVHDTDTIDLASLVPTWNITLLSKSEGVLPGNIVLVSPQFCESAPGPTPPGGNGTYCGGNYQGAPTNPFTPLYLVPQPLSFPGVVGTIAQNGGCYASTVTALLGPNNLTRFSIPSTTVHSAAICGPTSATVTTNDGSGITVTITFGSAPPGQIAFVTAANNSAGWSLNYTTGVLSDAFGNTSTNTGTSFTDSLGAVTNLNPGGSNYLSYTDTNGHTQNITYTAGTSQPFTGPQEWACGGNNSLNATPPVTAFNFPDGTSLTLNWAQAFSGLDGLIGSITLRTGGTITITPGGWANGCTTATNNAPAYSSLTRTTPDGNTTFTAVTSNNITTTTVLDAGKNKTVYVFFGTPWLGPTFTKSVTRYENSGTVQNPTYFQTSSTTYCYNNNSCPTAPAYPITQRSVYQYAGPNSFQMSHDSQTFDSYGNVLTDAATDDVTHTTITTTTAYGGCGVTNTNVQNKPCSITTIEGGNQIAKRSFTYNANGAPLTSVDWISSTLSLTTNYTPNTNGNGTITAIQDPNGQTTNYGFNGTGQCPATGNGLLPISTSTTVNSVSISTATTWDCNGAVVTSTTDANLNEDDTTYDVMFRPLSHTDYNEAVTSFGYTYNSVSTTDPLGVVHYAYVDGVGRPTVTQVPQTTGGSNYDTISKAYQFNGAHWQTQVSVPCVTTALNQLCTSVAKTDLVNPALGPISTGDANGGGTSSNYFFQTTPAYEITAGPKPSSDNSTKSVQTQKDGFGRPYTRCQVETSGGVACGGLTGNFGILTSFSYSFAVGSSTTTTTRGSQTHTTISDAIGRPTSIAIPESGTTSNVYDSYASGVCSGALGGHGVTSSPGDLMLQTFPSTSQECFVHDGLHRITDKQTSTANECRRFRFDATANGVQSTPSGYPSSGANIVGRMVEAETDNCSAYPPTSATVITDEWFAYDKDGRETGRWVKTPNSGGYFHVTVAYNANGTVTSISGIPHTSAFTFGVDQEGRPFNSKLGSTWLVGSSSTTGVTYDAAGRPLTIPIGASGGSDTYTYDSLEQMKTFTFAGNGKSMGGTLTWNKIGSLGKLVIVDTFNSGGAQTCNYAYDDVARLITNNCGTVLNQTYSYDDYDNLTQTNWNPGYTASNNHQMGSTYDGNGNVLYDGVNTYTWNLYGKMTGFVPGNSQPSCGSSGNSCLTYDALGNPVEVNNGGTIYQSLYGPTGDLGLMNAQNSPYNVYVPQPGGGAVQTSSGGTYYAHSDWLGTKRLITLVSNGSSASDTAYTPYGQVYAEVQGPVLQSDWAGIVGSDFSALWDADNRELFPNSGRWESPDPAHASWNAYAYPTDPNRQTDPSGADAGCGGIGCQNPFTDSNLLLQTQMGGDGIHCVKCLGESPDPLWGSVALSPGRYAIVAAMSDISGFPDVQALGVEDGSSTSVQMAAAPGLFIFAARKEVVKELYRRAWVYGTDITDADVNWIADRAMTLRTMGSANGADPFANFKDPFSWAVGDRLSITTGAATEAEAVENTNEILNAILRSEAGPGGGMVPGGGGGANMPFIIIDPILGKEIELFARRNIGIPLNNWWNNWYGNLMKQAFGGPK